MNICGHAQNYSFQGYCKENSWEFNWGISRKYFIIFSKDPKKEQKSTDDPGIRWDFVYAAYDHLQDLVRVLVHFPGHKYS